MGLQTLDIVSHGFLREKVFWKKISISLRFSKWKFSLRNAWKGDLRITNFRFSYLTNLKCKSDPIWFLSTRDLVLQLIKAELLDLLLFLRYSFLTCLGFRKINKKDSSWSIFQNLKILYLESLKRYRAHTLLLWSTLK